MMELKEKPIILQQFFKAEVNNGGPATGAQLLLDSNLKEKYQFALMTENHPFSEGVFKQFIYFYKTIRKTHPDLVHIRGIQSEGFYGVLACKLLRCKVVMSVHGIYTDSRKLNPLKRFIYKNVLERYALRNADAVYCVCKYAAERDYIRNNTKGHLTGYIHNAAPEWDLSNKSVMRKDYRDYLECSKNDVLFSYVGRVTEDKGMGVLLKAFKQIASNYPNAKLCLAGTGSYLKIIEEQYADFISQKRVILLGKSNKVKDLLCASDIFVFPTLHENLSNALLEAAVVGLPIIATEVGGNPEVIARKDMGILIEPSNVAQLYESMKCLVSDSDKRVQLGANIRRYVNGNFSSEMVFSEIEKVYDAVLAKD